MYTTIQVGAKNTPDYKVYIKRDNRLISPWHDIDPITPEYIRCVNEIPRFSNAKLEINKKLPANPITQDTKNGQLRYVSNIFPSNGYPWNYGAIPQTWEDPHRLDKYCQIYGDDDPLDVVDISGCIKEVGEVYEAKILGSLVMIDEGECDYKIIVIDRNCHMANSMEDISDVEVLCPGLLGMTKEWFRDYKLPDGKKQNMFAFDEEFKDKGFTMSVIENAHCSYMEMMKIIEDDFSHNYSALEERLVEFNGKDEKIPKEVEEFVYVKK